MRISDQARAAIIMCVGMLFIPVGDTAGKLLTDTNGIAPIFVAWSRFFLGAILVYAAFGGKEFDFKILKDWRIWLRAGFIVGGIICILTALRTEPIANVFAAFFIGPIVSYFVSALILKESVSLSRTVLLFVGFIGVLVVVKPGADFSSGIVYALLAGTFYGCFLVASKWLSMHSNPRSLLLSHLVIGTIVLMPMGMREVPTLSGHFMALIFLSAAASALGNLLLVVANRLTEASRLAPLVYVQLISATALGFIVFGNWPEPLTLLGLFLLLLSGFRSVLLGRTH